MERQAAGQLQHILLLSHLLISHHRHDNYSVVTTDPLLPSQICNHGGHQHQHQHQHQYHPHPHPQHERYKPTQVSRTTMLMTTGTIAMLTLYYSKLRSQFTTLSKPSLKPTSSLHCCSSLLFQGRHRPTSQLVLANLTMMVKHGGLELISSLCSPIRSCTVHC